jgi:hypothetical protein
MSLNLSLFFVTHSTHPEHNSYSDIMRLHTCCLVLLNVSYVLAIDEAPTPYTQSVATVHNSSALAKGNSTNSMFPFSVMDEFEVLDTTEHIQSSKEPYKSLGTEQKTLLAKNEITASRHENIIIRGFKTNWNKLTSVTNDEVIVAGLITMIAFVILSPFLGHAISLILACYMQDRWYEILDHHWTNMIYYDMTCMVLYLTSVAAVLKHHKILGAVVSIMMFACSIAEFEASSEYFPLGWATETDTASIAYIMTGLNCYMVAASLFMTYLIFAMIFNQ